MTTPRDDMGDGEPTGRMGRQARRVLIRSVAIAVPIAVLWAAVAGAVVMRGPERHASRAVLVIDQPLRLTNASDAGILLKLNALRFKYAALVPTTVISAPAADRAGVPVPLIRRSVTIPAGNEALIIPVLAEDTNPERAQIMAQAVAETLVDFVSDEQEGLPVEEDDQVVLRIVEPASPGIQFEPDERRAFAVAAVTGVVSLLVLVPVIQHMGMRRLRRRRAG